jgi:site-specific recombinase XerD
MLRAFVARPGCKPCELAAARNKVMFLLMLDAGLRVGEASRLLLTDLFLGSATVRTLFVPAEIAKNKEPRTIPLTRRLCDALTDYYNRLPEAALCEPAAYAFYGPKYYLPITTRQVERIIAFVSITTIGRAIHPHILRHTFATRLMQKTSMRIVQQLLGHKSITSTQVYTHPNSVDLTEAIKAIETGSTPSPSPPTTA